MKSLLLILVQLIIFSFTVHANEPAIQKLGAARFQLESLSSELQTELRASSSQSDRMNEKIITLQEEIKDIQRKQIELKAQRKQILQDLSKKSQTQNLNINPVELLASINAYEVFVRNGLPWDVDRRLDKLNLIKSSFEASKDSLSELTLQWSQYLESERTLATTSEFSVRRIRIDSLEQDASVLRLGLTILYYKTSQNKTGLFYRKNSHLVHQEISDETLREKIIKLVENNDLKKSPNLLSELVLTSSMKD